MALNIDKDGYVLDGRFAGKHIDTVLQYTESLEAAAAAPSNEQKPPKRSPAEELNNNAEGRVDAATLLTAQRFEADDLAAFRSRVGEEEFKKYEGSISAVMKGLAPSAKMVKDVHWAIYVQIKSREEGFADRLMGKGAPPAPAPKEGETPPANEEEETEEEREAREAEERAAEARKKAEEARAARSAPPAAPPPKPAAAPPRASGPTAPPSPAGRKPGGERKPKLVATPKIERAAREWGMTVEKYLLQLEDRGLTQADVERESAPKEEKRRRSVFDRPTAS